MNIDTRFKLILKNRYIVSMIFSEIYLIHSKLQDHDIFRQKRLLTRFKLSEIPITNIFKYGNIEMYKFLVENRLKSQSKDRYIEYLQHIFNDIKINYQKFVFGPITVLETIVLNKSTVILDHLIHQVLEYESPQHQFTSLTSNSLVYNNKEGKKQYLDNNLLTYAIKHKSIQFVRYLLLENPSLIKIKRSQISDIVGNWNKPLNNLNTTREILEIVIDWISVTIDDNDKSDKPQTLLQSMIDMHQDKLKLLAEWALKLGSYKVTKILYDHTSVYFNPVIVNYAFGVDLLKYLMEEQGYKLDKQILQYITMQGDIQGLQYLLGVGGSNGNIGNTNHPPFKLGQSDFEEALISSTYSQHWEYAEYVDGLNTLGYRKLEPIYNCLKYNQFDLILKLVRYTVEDQYLGFQAYDEEGAVIDPYLENLQDKTIIKRLLDHFGWQYESMPSSLINYFTAGTNNDKSGYIRWLGVVSAYNGWLDIIQQIYTLHGFKDNVCIEYATTRDHIEIVKFLFDKFKYRMGEYSIIGYRIYEVNESLDYLIKENAINLPEFFEICRNSHRYLYLSLMKKYSLEVGKIKYMDITTYTALQNWKLLDYAITNDRIELNSIYPLNLVQIGTPKKALNIITNPKCNKMFEKPEFLVTYLKELLKDTHPLKQGQYLVKIFNHLIHSKPITTLKSIFQSQEQSQTTFDFTYFQNNYHEHSLETVLTDQSQTLLQIACGYKPGISIEIVKMLIPLYLDRDDTVIVLLRSLGSAVNSGSIVIARLLIAHIFKILKGSNYSATKMFAQLLRTLLYSRYTFQRMPNGIEMTILLYDTRYKVNQL